MVQALTGTLQVACPNQAILGEGALWDDASQQLLWVDITGKQVGLFDPASGRNRLIPLPSRVGTVVPTADGQLLVALQEGVATLNRETGQLSPFRCPAGHDPVRVRFNDGKCDPAGRFWAGTTALDFAAGQGALYSFAGNEAGIRRLKDVTISNGIVWSADARTLYYIDTPTRQVDAFDFNLETGAICNRRCVCTIPVSAGYPDGMTIDEEDMLWIAMWGGAAVTRWNPVSGAMIARISLPVTNVTSCAFGGRELDQLFITTAREGRTAAELGQEPLAGAIFVARTGVRGRRTFAYKS